MEELGWLQQYTLLGDMQNPLHLDECVEAGRELIWHGLFWLMVTGQFDIVPVRCSLVVCANSLELIW